MLCVISKVSKVDSILMIFLFDWHNFLRRFLSWGKFSDCAEVADILKILSLPDNFKKSDFNYVNA